MTDVSAMVMPAQLIRRRMKRLRYQIQGILPDMILDLELGSPLIPQKHHLYPRVMLNLKLDGESNAHS